MTFFACFYQFNMFYVLIWTVTLRMFLKHYSCWQNLVQTYSLENLLCERKKGHPLKLQGNLFLDPESCSSSDEEQNQKNVLKDLVGVISPWQVIYFSLRGRGGLCWTWTGMSLNTLNKWIFTRFVNGHPC